MMMGTADEVVKAPKTGLVFTENMPDEALVVNVVKFLNTFFTLKFTGDA